MFIIDFLMYISVTDNTDWKHYFSIMFAGKIYSRSRGYHEP